MKTRRFCMDFFFMNRFGLYSEIKMKYIRKEIDTDAKESPFGGKPKKQPKPKNFDHEPNNSRPPIAFIVTCVLGGEKLMVTKLMGIHRIHTLFKGVIFSGISFWWGGGVLIDVCQNGGKTNPSPTPRPLRVGEDRGGKVGQQQGRIRRAGITPQWRCLLSKTPHS